MNHTEQIKELASALVKFQGEVPVITFDSKVSVKTKTGGSYGFAYASLKAIKETCKPILLKNELAVSQLVGAKKLTTILIHSSGQFISDAMELPIKDGMNPQEIGSVITYMKRYSFSAILGLVSDEDDDANIAEGNAVQKKQAPKLLTLKKGDANWQKVVTYLCQENSNIELVKGKYDIDEKMEVQLLKEAVDMKLNQEAKK